MDFGGGSSESAYSSATASNSFGNIGGENVGIIALVVVVVLALVLIIKK